MYFIFIYNFICDCIFLKKNYVWLLGAVENAYDTFQPTPPLQYKIPYDKKFRLYLFTASFLKIC